MRTPDESGRGKWKGCEFEERSEVDARDSGKAFCQRKPGRLVG